MGLIELYVWFATTTALVACYELFWPVLSSLRITHPELPVLQNMWITMPVFFLVAWAMAPVTLLPCIVPRMGARFRKTFWETLLQR